VYEPIIGAYGGVSAPPVTVVQLSMIEPAGISSSFM